MDILAHGTLCIAQETEHLYALCSKCHGTLSYQQRDKGYVCDECEVWYPKLDCSGHPEPTKSPLSPEAYVSEFVEIQQMTPAALAWWAEKWLGQPVKVEVEL